MKNPKNSGKRVETGVDPCLRNYPLGESPTASLCQVECRVGTSDCESRTFYCLRLKRQQYNWDGIRTLAGFISFRFFRSRSRVPVRFRSMLDSIS